MEISTLFQFFDSFSTLFLTFWAPGPEGPGNSFSIPFPTLGPKCPRTPLGGLKGRNVSGRYFYFLAETERADQTKPQNSIKQTIQTIFNLCVWKVEKQVEGISICEQHICWEVVRADFLHRYQKFVRIVRKGLMTCNPVNMIVRFSSMGLV